MATHSNLNSFIYKYINILISKIKLKLFSFHNSILFYPFIFTLISVFLFIITSTIDKNLFSSKISFDIPYVQYLVFAGSAQAARSILSTIAAGWATILGVAFSVTFISLQLSTSRYTSHLINRFEQDKINQITLGWFIFVVSYSLLLLKTVRIAEIPSTVTFSILNNTSASSNLSNINNIDLSSSFTPILGVNISIIISIIGLFIFVLFVKNISSYLRPNILISDITNKIINSLKSYNDRVIDKESISKIKLKKIVELQTKDKGIITNINHKKIIGTIRKELFIKEIKKKEEFNKLNGKRGEEEISNEKKFKFLLEWSKAEGENVNKYDLLATLYRYQKNEKKDEESLLPNPYKTSSSINMSQSPSLLKNDNFDIQYNNNNVKNKISYKKGIEKNNPKENETLYSNIISSVQITKDRNLNSDPLYGIDLLQSMAIKASNSKDIDIVKSCITGLFDILRYLIKNGDILGNPFVLYKNDKKNKLLKIKNKDQINNHHQKNLVKDKIYFDLDNKISKTNNNQQKLDDLFSLIIKPKEMSLIKIILSELSVICSSCTENDKIHIFNSIVLEYIRLSKFVVNINDIDTFIYLTEWISSQIKKVEQVINIDLLYNYSIEPIINFKSDITTIGSSSICNSFNSIIDPIIEMIRLNYNRNKI